MTEPGSPAERTASPRMRRLTASTLVVLIVMLPVLLAFARIDAPVSAAETARVREAVLAEEVRSSEPLTMFYGAALSADSPALWAAKKDEITMRARVSGMLALFGVSSLLYLLLLFVRGRATAAVGCLALCVIPAVGEEGHVLRQEQCSTLFGLLGVVLIAGFPLMLQERRHLIMPWLSRFSLMLVVGVSFGVARSCQLGAWVYLTVPAAALLLSVMTLALMFPRAVRGVALIYWPFRAAARRYVPWMFLVLVSFSLTLLVLERAGGIADDSQSDFGLLPKSWLGVPLAMFAGIGALRMILGVGIRIGRLRRVRPDTVLFLYVSALMMQHFLMRDGVDQLPAAVAFACLVADGVMTTAVLGLGHLARRRRSNPTT